MPSTRVATFHRIASAPQDNRGLTAQSEALRARCAANGFEVVAEIVAVGQSAYYDSLDTLRADSPEYDALMRLVEREEIDTIIVHAYDRLWRSSALALQVRELCQQHHVEIVSTSLDEELCSGSLIARLGAILREAEESEETAEEPPDELDLIDDEPDGD